VKDAHAADPLPHRDPRGAGLLLAACGAHGHPLHEIGTVELWFRAADAALDLTHEAAEAWGFSTSIESPAIGYVLLSARGVRAEWRYRWRTSGPRAAVAASRVHGSPAPAKASGRSCRPPTPSLR
jgi:hypothetical protein